MAKLYVGCSLTESPEAFKQTVDQLKHLLRAQGHDVFDFLGLSDGTPEGVYKWDIRHCVETCDAFIGVCDFPSIGLGLEMGEAIHLGKPVLMVAHHQATLTRMVPGAAIVEPNVMFVRYNNLLADVPALVKQLVRQTNGIKQ